MIRNALISRSRKTEGQAAILLTTGKTNSLGVSGSSPRPDRRQRGIDEDVEVIGELGGRGKREFAGEGSGQEPAVDLPPFPHPGGGRDQERLDLRARVQVAEEGAVQGPRGQEQLARRLLDLDG